MHPDRESERPRRPARRFPADSAPGGPVPDHQRVDLTFESSQLLSGSVGGQPVALELNTPASEGTAAGTIAGMPIWATWQVADNNSVYPDVPCQLTGTFAGQPVELRASFHLEPGYFFDHGIISGHIGAVALEATAERIAGGLGSTSAVAVDGRLGGTDFTIYAAVDGPLTTGKIRGTVAGAAIRIDAARTRQPGAEKIRLTGSYEGSPELAALAAGALLDFI